MKRYVVGFNFSADKKMVVLIRKNKPQWQKGRLNGVGGKVEENETAEAAMVREFEEEAGVRNDAWQLFCILKFMDCEVYCFKSFLDCEVKTMEEEKVDWYPVAALSCFFTIPNILWLATMALDNSVLMAKVSGIEGL